jgi:hypothetical protein
MPSVIEEWKREKEERLKTMLKKIFDSDFAKEWIRDRQKNLKEEVEFYGRELTELEWKSNLISDFFDEDFSKICAVLPEIWNDVKERVKDALDDVLKSPKTFEDAVTRHMFSECVEVPFKLSGYLEDLMDELLETLKKQ